MAIRDIQARKEEKEFPLVSWEEDRSLLAGGGAVRIACHIKPKADTGQLMFALTSSKASERQEDGRPWAALKSFTYMPWSQEFQSGSDRSAINLLLNRYRVGQAAASDGALVLVAQFEDMRPSVLMYLSRADCSVADMRGLHDHMTREFITLRDAEKGYIDSLCGANQFVWPKDMPVPPPPTLSAPSSKGMRWWEPVIALGVVAGTIYWAMRGFARP